MSEIVFILGAGASKQAGAPLMKEFIDKARELHSEGKCDGYEKHFENVFKGISELQKAHSKSKLDIYNIESVFAAFEMGGLINCFPGHDEDEIKILISSMKHLIRVTLEQSIKFSISSSSHIPIQSHDKFVKLVMHLNRHKPRCSILTFNYDCALDYTMMCNNASLNYCLEDTTSANTKVIKLHGFLNWAICPHCKNIVPLKFHRYWPFSSKQEFDKYDFPSTPMPLKVDLSDFIHCDKKVKSDPVIVPPTWNKTGHQKNISIVWKAAAKELSEAENIFVCGYSLPETDFFFRYLYGLGTIGDKIIENFIIFDPDRERTPFNRFKGLLGAGIEEERFKPVQNSFAALPDFVRNLLKTGPINW